MRKYFWLVFLILPPSLLLYELPSAKAAINCAGSGFKWGLAGGGQGGGLGYMDPYNWPGHRTQDTDADVQPRWDQMSSAAATLFQPVGVGWYRENLKFDQILLNNQIPSPVGTSSYSGYLSMSEAQIDPIIDEFAFPTDTNNPFHIQRPQLLRQDYMVNSLASKGICFVGMLAPGISRDLPFCDGIQCPSGAKVSPTGLGPANYLGLVYLFSRAMVRRYSSNSVWDVRYWQIENEIDLTLIYEIAGWRQWDLYWGSLANAVIGQPDTLNILFIESLMSTLSSAVKHEGTYLNKQLWVVHNYGFPLNPLGFIGAQYVDIIGIDVYWGKLNYASPNPTTLQGLATGAEVTAAKIWNKPVWVMESGYSVDSVLFGLPLPESEQSDYDYNSALSAAGTASGFFLFTPTSPEGGSSPPDENGYGLLKPVYDSSGNYVGPAPRSAWTNYQSVISCVKAVTCSAGSQARQTDNVWPTVGEVPVEDLTKSGSPEQWSITSTDTQITQNLRSIQNVDNTETGDNQLTELGNPNMVTDLSTTFETVKTITGASAIHVDTRFGTACDAYNGVPYSSADVSASVQIYDLSTSSVVKQWTVSDCDTSVTYVTHFHTFSDEVLLKSSDSYSVRLVAWDQRGSAFSQYPSSSGDPINLQWASWEYVHISVIDFGVSANGANDPNSSIPAPQGAAVSWGVDYSSIGNFQSPITLSSWWEGTTPSGTSVSFSQPTANPKPGSDSFILPTVSTSTSTPTGTYKLHITGTTSYGLSQDVWFSINVVTSSSGGRGGSIMAGTLVLLSNGYSTPVQNVVGGFMSIRSFDPAANRFFNASVNYLLLKHVNNLYVIGTDKGNPVRVDYYEQFWVQLANGTRQWMLAGQLQIGDEILRPVDGVWAAVTSINIASGSFTVYDVVITPTLQNPLGAMPVIANGYLDMKTCGC